jgi:hypothetical protein
MPAVAWVAAGEQRASFSPPTLFLFEGWIGEITGSILRQSRRGRSLCHFVHRAIAVQSGEPGIALRANRRAWGNLFRLKHLQCISEACLNIFIYQLLILFKDLLSTCHYTFFREALC